MSISSQFYDHCDRDRRALLKSAAALGLTAAWPATARAQEAGDVTMRSPPPPGAGCSGNSPRQPCPTKHRCRKWNFSSALPNRFAASRFTWSPQTIPTHVYEARFLARAFREITDIGVVHDLVREGELVERIQQQVRTGPQFLRRLCQRFRLYWHTLPV